MCENIGMTLPILKFPESKNTFLSWARQHVARTLVMDPAFIYIGLIWNQVSNLVLNSKMTYDTSGNLKKLVFIKKKF